MIPALLNSICRSYESEVAILTAELRETHKLLARAQALNIEQAELLRRQQSVIEAARVDVAKFNEMLDGALKDDRPMLQHAFIE